MNRKPLLNPIVAALVVALVQTLVLGYMIESRASILRNGAEVVLKTVPVDPRDLLRGDYVVLAYEISTIPPETISGALPAESGDTQLWVRLQKQPDGFWGASEASFVPLSPADGSVIARSRPFYYYATPDSRPGPVSVEYGIERYYVPEGEGVVLEEARTAGALSVTARADNAGRMQIRLIARDGQPLYEEPLY